MICVINDSYWEAKSVLWKTLWELGNQLSLQLRGFWGTEVSAYNLPKIPSKLGGVGCPTWKVKMKRRWG